MKRTLSVVFIALVAGACDFYVVEPRVDWRDRVVGRYQVDEYSHTYNSYTFYSIRILKSGGYDHIHIDNFYNSGMRIRAYISYDKITIPYQIVNGYEIEGVGTVYGSSIDLSYSVKDLYQPLPTDFCETEAYFDY